MPAKIIQPNSEPFKKVDIDPITLDIIESALRSARYEMDAVLYRTAMSPGIREQHDEFPMIASPGGKMVVGQFGSFIHGFNRDYDGTIEEGDLFLTSDPYSCAGAISHAPDWLVMRPVFLDGRLIAYAAMFGHMTDVGGKVPGSLPTDAAQIYEEGVVIPIVKIYKNDELQEDVLKVILHQCRMPQWNHSDFNALVAAVRMAEKRVLELCERFGVDMSLRSLTQGRLEGPGNIRSVRSQQVVQSTYQSFNLDDKPLLACMGLQVEGARSHHDQCLLTRWIRRLQRFNFSGECAARPSQVSMPRSGSRGQQLPPGPRWFWFSSFRALRRVRCHAGNPARGGDNRRSQQRGIGGTAIAGMVNDTGQVEAADCADPCRRFMGLGEIGHL